MTHCEVIYEHLKKYGSISTWEAIEKYGVTRLSAVIYSLRKDNVKITSKYVTKTNRYGNKVHYKEYYLRSEENEDV